MLIYRFQRQIALSETGEMLLNYRKQVEQVHYVMAIPSMTRIYQNSTMAVHSLKTILLAKVSLMGLRVKIPLGMDFLSTRVHSNFFEALRTILL